MKILVVVDMQKDFVNMALGTKEAQKIVPNVVKKINEANGQVVITTYDTHGHDYLDTLEGQKLPVPHCIPDTDGWMLDDAVREALEADDRVLEEWIEVTKPTFGYMKWQDILKDIPDIEEIEICGLCTDICVISNALILRALMPNTKMVIDHTCCAGVTPEKHEAALEVARSCQIDVI